MCLYKVNPTKNNDFTATFWRVYEILAKFGNLHFSNAPIFVKYSSGGLRIFFTGSYYFSTTKKNIRTFKQKFWILFKNKEGGSDQPPPPPKS